MQPYQKPFTFLPQRNCKLLLGKPKEVEPNSAAEQKKKSTYMRRI